MFNQVLEDLNISLYHQSELLGIGRHITAQAVHILCMCAYIKSFTDGQAGQSLRPNLSH